MREIIFRGKRKDNGKWIEGYYFKKINAHTEDGLPLFHGIADLPPFGAEIVPETLGQYTGLTDKNGTRIFEGDIVKTEKFNTPSKRYVIKYDLLLGAFIGEDDGTMYFTTFDGDSELFEVIGNIHDNPELLKGGVQ